MLSEKKYIIVAILVIWPNIFSGFGQFVKKAPLTQFSGQQTKSAQPGIPVSLDEKISSLALHIHPDDSFEGSKVIISSDTIELTLNEHADSVSEYLTSNLIVFDKPLSDFKILTGEGIHHLQEVTLFFIYAPPVEHKKPARKKKTFSEDCSVPEMIDQETWRAGLPEPDYPRILNEVHNIIVHHSAGSNTNTNYTDVVRNIYLYHTGVNGWSDIGYNYVVAQDGSIFKGRDPGPLAQDSVMGAHFCGSNTGTLGICVLGNYVETEVPENALVSLADLIIWKAYQDTLHPTGTFQHPLNYGLHVIAGHRDGCSTLCPGDVLYQSLDEIRLDVLTGMENCGYVPSGIDVVDEPSFIVVYPNPARSELWIRCDCDKEIEFKSITTISGTHISANVVSREPGKLALDLQNYPPGQYIISFEIDGKIFSHSIIVQK